MFEGIDGLQLSRSKKGGIFDLNLAVG